MGYRNLVVVEKTRYQGGAHPLALRLGLGGLIDDLVGAMDGISEHDGLAHIAGPGLDITPILPGTRLPDQVDDRLDRDPAGDLAGVVAAHAVREDHQADVRIRSDRILIVIPDFAGVGQLNVGEFAFETHLVSVLSRPSADFSHRLAKRQRHLGTGLVTARGVLCQGLVYESVQA